MKKFLALALAVVMVMACGLSIYAAETTKSVTLDDAGTADQTVCVASTDKDGDEIEPAKVYSVTIDFDTLHFDYVFDVDADELIWDPETHTYADATGDPVDGDWTNNNQTVTVTNDSNASVGVAAAFETSGSKSASLNNVTATISASDGTLATAEGTAADAGPSLTYTVSVAGQPNSLEHFTIDTVVVTISK